MVSKRLVWLAGKLVPAEDAKINVFSPTCQYGINVFESIRCYRSECGRRLLAFRLDCHLRRLFRSAKILGLKMRYCGDEIRQAFMRTVRTNGYAEDISVRIVIYVDEPGNWAYAGDCEMLIAPIAMGRAFQSKDGISCCVSSWGRIDDSSVSPRVKAGANYINSRMAQLEAAGNGFDSTLPLNRERKVSEAPGSCVFMVRDGCLVTPPVTASILESITRDTIIRLARNELGLTVVERNIDRTELYICDEVFLCGTAVEVVPVTSVDRICVGTGQPGEVTRGINEKYFGVVRGRNRRYPEWNHPID